MKTALSQWPHGYKSTFTDELGPMKNNEKCYLVKFKGDPWFGSHKENESMHSRVTIQTLINELKKSGWSLLFSSGITGEYKSRSNGSYSIDCHSLFLVKTNCQYFGEDIKFDTPAPPSYLQNSAVDY